MTVRKSDPIGVALGSKITKPGRDQNQPFWWYSDMERNIDRNLRMANGEARRFFGVTGRGMGRNGVYEAISSA